MSASHLGPRFLDRLFRRRGPRVFISYRRRGDGAGYGGRIADKLVEHFGPEQCFRDVEDIESGVDFVETIHDAIQACDALLAVIGPDWLTQTDAGGGRRLDDPNDFVRIEVAAALGRGIRVIPVLVGGAAMPAAEELPDALAGLARRQAHELTDSRWEFDVGGLLQSVESIGVRATRSKRRQESRSPRWKIPAAVAGACGVAALAAASIPDPSDPFPAPDLALPHEVAPAFPEEGWSEPPVAAAPTGRAAVSWRHEGLVHRAEITMLGNRGLARVMVGPVRAEQDLALVRKDRGVFYVGSAVRFPGTRVPHPYYTPDIFRLERGAGGRWTVSEVGTSWDHFDEAIAAGF